MRSELIRRRELFIRAGVKGLVVRTGVEGYSSSSSSSSSSPLSSSLSLSSSSLSAEVEGEGGASIFRKTI